MKSTISIPWKHQLLMLFILLSFFATYAHLKVEHPKLSASLIDLIKLSNKDIRGFTETEASTLKGTTENALSNESFYVGVTEKLKEFKVYNGFPSTFTSASSTGNSILVISGISNKFSQYTNEILTAEGLNGYSTTDIASVTADLLSNHDVVIIGNIALTDAQVAMLSDWTNAGGALIALKPDSKLASLFGITPVGGVLTNKYLLVNTSSGPGIGIVKQSMQYQGDADLYNVTNETTKIATLYSGANTATEYPAVTSRVVGNNGGVAIAFTYDLARSIVYTRQGNPEWAGQKRDGQSGPIRSDDQFYPDWIDLNKVEIPQADEQQRLLANIITLNSRKPLPRLWYLPRGLKATVVMTGDDHGNGGTKGRFDQYLQLSSDNSAEAVADWRAIRGTSYIDPNTQLTDNEAKIFEQQGFEIALHLNTGCLNFTESSLENNLVTQLAQFKSSYPSIAAPITNRTHCIAWSDWSTQPKLEANKGIRLDANYYYWPSAWIQNRPGMFTGSGIPMRFADIDGSLIDCYQLTTQMTDESDQVFPFTIDHLLNKALGPEGYYGVFCANMHTDAATSDGSDAIIASAKSRDIPVISSKQLLTWLDGRNNSTFNFVNWNGNELQFGVDVAAGAKNLEGMLPLTDKVGQLVSLSVNGEPVSFRIEKIKGIDYAFFRCKTGNYLATYDSNALPNRAPVVSISSPIGNAEFTAPASISITANASDEDGTITKVEFFQGSTKVGEDLASPYEFTWENVPGGDYTLTARATDDKGTVTVSDIVNISVSTICPCTIFRPTEGPTGTLNQDNSTGIQLGMKFQSTVDGSVTGVRFYKQSGNTGTHTGQLYSSSGSLLASVVFSNETASGWQEATFSSPVAVTAGTTYLISYHSSAGYYSNTNMYFQQSVRRGSLIGLSDGTDGANGVYLYTATPSFPTATYQAANYWVDAVFVPNNGPVNQKPTVSLTSPLSNSSFTAPATVNLEAVAADGDGDNTLTKVEFFQGVTRLGEVTSSPYNFTWDNVLPGNYQLTAKAFDNAGAFTTSEPVNIFVTGASGQNDIVSENALPGSPESEWQISGAGDLSIQGFATDISYNVGETARFKIKTGANAYTVKIYRLGYYQGRGARYQGDATITASLPQSQPNCRTDSGTGLVDCGNWEESASWAIPSNAVSGVYIAKLTRTGGGSSHIVFIVRNDASTSNLMFQTSDATWQAYNVYGDNNNGKSLYTGAGGKAVKVSYNRPFLTRNGGGGGDSEMDWLFNAEYPMIRWIEANGYDVTYTTNVDSDRRGHLIKNHKAFLSVGHDEYWSGAHRANVTAARDAGTSLAFFSGNEVYWKTRWENSIDGSGTSYRTLVCYKEGAVGENICNGKCDPSPEWTGLWRSGCEYKTGNQLSDGCQPENALTGQISWAENTAALKVSSTYKNLRFWRNTSIASLGDGQTATLTEGIIGYEWNPEDEQYRSTYPPGRIILSETNISGLTHHLSLYKHTSGALVFGAGTVQYSWGLDSNHDRGSAAPSIILQQATVNLFADMGAQPRTLQSGLVYAAPSTDTQSPNLTISSPSNGANIASGASVIISGTASDGGVVAGVEVSTDGGTSWRPASGTNNWTFTWVPSVQGAVTIQSRAFDDSGNISAPVSVNVTIGESGPVTCPCTVFSPTEGPTGTISQDNSTGIQLGMKFQSTVDGSVTGVRFYKQSGNTGTHTGQLYSSSGSLLASVVFSNETASGWQEATFSSPVAVTAGTTYLISYHSSAGYYSNTDSYFQQSVRRGPLIGLSNGTDGANGVYLYTATPSFPTATYQAANYWVDAVFSSSGNQSPVVSTPIPDQSATAGVSYSFIFEAGTFTDPDADPLSYAASLSDGGALPSWLSFDGATRTFSGTPAAAGTLSLRVTASDGRGGSAVADFALAVSSGNQSPVVSTPIPDQSATAGVSYSFIFEAGTFTDPDADPLSYAASLSDGGALPSWLSFDGATRTFSGTPAAAGTLSLRVTASDGRGGSAVADFALAVSSGNQSPVVSTPIPDQSATAGVSYSFIFEAGTFTDPDADPLSYAASLSDGGALPSWLSFDGATRTFSGTPAAAGTLSLRVTASDGRGGSAVADFALAVSSGNQSPVVSTPIPDQSATAGVSYSFIFEAGTFTDPDADPLSYAASLSDGGALPSWLSFDGATRTFSGTPAAAGTLSLRVTASDGRGGSAVADFALAVSSGNQSPVVSTPIPDQSATAGVSYSFIFEAGTFTDPDADPLSYAASLSDGGALPSWLSFDGATRTFSGTPAAAGTLSLRVTASDGRGGSAVADFALAVSSGNQSPVVSTPIPDQSATAGVSYSFIFDAGTFTDPDADPLSYAASLSDGGALPSWLSFDGATRTFSGTPAAAGTLSLRVTASDGRGGSAVADFALAVSSGNQSPVVSTPIPDQSATAGVSYSFIFEAGTFTDPDADPLSYAASLSDGGALPSWLSFDGATRTFSGTPAAAGTLSLRVTASDGRGGSAVADFALAVSSNPPAIPLLSLPSNNSSGVALPPTLSWGAAAGADSYHVQVSTLSTFSAPVFDRSGLSATTATVDGLSKGTTYYWRVRASNASGSSAWSSTWSFTTADDGSTPPAGSLVAHYKMDEGGGLSLVDASGYGNNANTHGNPTWVTGKSGMALQLNGKGQYASAADHGSLDITGPMTLATWIRAGARANQYLIHKATNGSVDGYELSLTSAGLMLFRINQATNGEALRVNSSTLYPADGATWVHVAATYDGTTARIYVNGVEEKLKNFGSPTSIKANDLPLGIGAQHNKFRSFNGAMDEVRVYNRALSTQEIAELINSPVPSGPPAIPLLTSPSNNSSGVALPPTLSWGAAAGADSYHVQVSTLSTFSAPVFDRSGLSATTATVDGLSKGTTYYWRVRASNASGSSAWSSTWSFTTADDGSTPPAGSLVAHYKMDEGGGLSLVDASGYGNNANTHGNPTWVTGKSGMALQLSGKGQYASAADHGSLDITGPMTLATWIRAGARANQYLIHKATNGSVDGYELSLTSAGLMLFRINQATNGEALRVNSSTLYPADGATWVHVAATYDGTTARIYVNGVEEKLKNFGSPTSIKANDLPLGIGAQHNKFRSFNGAMDEVRVYNRALSTQEISSLAIGTMSYATGIAILEGNVVSENNLTVYPNPFDSYTTIRFSISQGEMYSLDLLDSKGMLIKEIVSGVTDKDNTIEAILDSSKLPRGLYLVRLRTDNGISTTKVVLER